MTTEAQTATYLHSTLNRLNTQQLPIWMLDPGDALTDIRAILGGKVTHLGRAESTLNLLHPFLMQEERRDAQELARILQVVHGQPFDPSVLTPAIHDYLNEKIKGGVFQGGSLDDMLTYLCTHPDTQTHETASQIAQQLDDLPNWRSIISSKTQLAEGRVRQITYPASHPLMHRLVTLTLNRLAQVASRQRNARLVMVTLVHPNDNDALGQMVWDSTHTSVLYLRGK